MKKLSLCRPLISLVLTLAIVIASPVLAQSVKDMKAVFTKLPMQNGASGSKPALVLPICASRTNSATKILMINTTLMATGDCPNVLVGFIKSAQSNAEVRLTEVIGEDYAFRNHLADGSAAKTIDKAGPWDYVLLQPHSKELIYKTANTIKDNQMLASMALAHKSQVYILDAWGTNDPAYYQLVERGNQMLASSLHAQRIPICTALFRAKDIPNVRLFRLDNHHLAADGVYLAACLMYARLLNRTPIGLPAKVYQGSRLMCEVTPEIAKQLQAVAANFMN